MGRRSYNDVVDSDLDFLSRFVRSTTDLGVLMHNVRDHEFEEVTCRLGRVRSIVIDGLVGLEQLRTHYRVKVL